MQLQAVYPLLSQFWVIVQSTSNGCQITAWAITKSSWKFSNVSVSKDRYMLPSCAAIFELSTPINSASTRCDFRPECWFLIPNDVSFPLTLCGDSRTSYPARLET
mmetsp:Transcript_11238/g.31294  ORF Transcript_11238/g.31294 Transcript_11238/m.31294 type:complete len:105 (-) Transcript_11238:770-1084(-)